MFSLLPYFTEAIRMFPILHIYQQESFRAQMTGETEAINVLIKQIKLQIYFKILSSPQMRKYWKGSSTFL